MNILPKKRWHVRTKENIARVRKDEAEAAEKEKQEQLRIEQADREARLSVLKHKSKQKLQEYGIKEPEPELPLQLPSGHINLFANFESVVQSTNKEHDKEIREKKEEYEKKIGFLTYFGQDTNEALGKKNWYEVLPNSAKGLGSSKIKDTYDKLVLKDLDGKPKEKEPDERNGEVSWKKKQMLDPMNAFKHLHHSQEKKISTGISKITNDNATSSSVNEKKNELTKKKKHKKDKNEDKQIKLQKLREARIKREQQEKYKTELFLKGLHKPLETNKKDTAVKAKYNSQFNPELARQNYR